jgi:putative phosphoesterase
MRIAVISDTHDRAPDFLYPEIRGADEIWHLGDVTTPGLLSELRLLGPPVRVVRGNCDPVTEWPLQLDLELEGRAVRLIHIPPAKPPPGIDLLLHGHTHVPRDEQIGATRYLNPGCLTRPNRGAPPSYAWLTLKRKKPVAWEIVPVPGRAGAPPSRR